MQPGKNQKKDFLRRLFLEDEIYQLASSCLLILIWQFWIEILNKSGDHNSYQTLTKMCSSTNKLVFVLFFGEIFAALFSRKYNQFEICDMQFEKGQFVKAKIEKSFEAVCKKCFTPLGKISSSTSEKLLKILREWLSVVSIKFREKLIQSFKRKRQQ